MTGWLAPVLAGAFWAGILAWPALRPALAVWQLLVAGVLGLAAAAWLAPGRGSEVPLVRAGLVEPVPPSRGPFAVSLERRGIVVVLSVRRFTRLGPSANPLVRATQRVRAALLDHLLRLFPSRQAGLLMGLALGDTSRLDPGDEEH